MNAARGQIQVPSATRWLHRNTLQSLARVAPKFFAARLRRPVFLIGCPRSGTSFFDQVFATHPSVVSYPSEALDLWHPQAYPWRTVAARTNLEPIWRDPRAFTTFTLAHRTANQDRHLQASFGALAAISGDRRFVNKCTMIGLMLPHVIELFPDAQLIHIVRDGRASALSWAQRQRQEIERHPAVFKQRNCDADFSTLLRRCAAAWKIIVEAIDDSRTTLGLGSDRFMQIRYEDFCNHPPEALASAAKFIGISPTGFDQQKCDRIASQNFKYKSELSTDEKKHLVAMLSPTLTRLGYNI